MHRACAAVELAARLAAWLLGVVAVLLVAGCRLDERFGPEVLLLTQGQAVAVGPQMPEGGPPTDAAWQPVTLPDAWDTNRPDYRAMSGTGCPSPRRRTHRNRWCCTCRR